MAQAVIETNFAAFQMILEMDVGRAAVKRGYNLRESQVVRGDHADRAAFHQAAHDGARRRCGDREN